MKRFHVHVSVADLDEAVPFYQALFGCAPSVQQADYAKWMLDDPRVNFAISTRAGSPGLDHLGIQVEEDGELAAVTQRLAGADALLLQQQGTCCYAESRKNWTRDPAGIAWETFLTTGASTTYGGAITQQGDTPRRAADAAKVIAINSCCAP